MLGFIPGWASLMPNVEIKDSTVTMLSVIALFVLPSNWNWVKFSRTQSKSLISWNYVNANLPWSLIFLSGGGFALAAGGEVSGMSRMLGEKLSSLSELPLLFLLFLLCFVIQIITEFVSSIAIVNGNILKEIHLFYLHTK